MSDEFQELKRTAGDTAAQAVQSGMVVGLGSGTTADFATKAVGRRLADGEIRNIICVPSSEKTARLARALHIPLTTLAEQPTLDIYIDGADEIDPQLQLIKGLGGSLLREKIVATAANYVIIISDYRKLVTQLGARSPLPVEVIRFAQRPVNAYLESLGARTIQRVKEGEIFITDEGNIILDCYFDEIADAAQLAQAVRAQPGVVEHGFFLNIADEAIIAMPDGIQRLQRP
jgi:ribose 5-phosphate isomerase A